MKSLVAFLVALWLGCQLSFAKDGNTSSTTTTTDTEKKEKKEITLLIHTTLDPITYSLIQPVTYVYLSDKTISINIDDFSDTFTVRVTNLSTGEVVFSQVTFNGTDINLPMCSKGTTYLLDIVSDDYWLQGTFTL